EATARPSGESVEAVGSVDCIRVGRTSDIIVSFRWELLVLRSAVIAVGAEARPTPTICVSGGDGVAPGECFGDEPSDLDQSVEVDSRIDASLGQVSNQVLGRDVAVGSGSERAAAVPAGGGVELGDAEVESTIDGLERLSFGVVQMQTDSDVWQPFAQLFEARLHRRGILRAHGVVYADTSDSDPAVRVGDLDDVLG